jgi:hypothetical protein
MMELLLLLLLLWWDHLRSGEGGEGDMSYSLCLCVY